MMKNKTLSDLFTQRLFFGTHDWIRTSTPFRALPPQSSMSTNFTTCVSLNALQR